MRWTRTRLKDGTSAWSYCKANGIPYRRYLDNYKKTGDVELSLKMASVKSQGRKYNACKYMYNGKPLVDVIKTFKPGAYFRVMNRISKGLTFTQAMEIELDLLYGDK